MKSLSPLPSHLGFKFRLQLLAVELEFWADLGTTQRFVTQLGCQGERILISPAPEEYAINHP